MSIFKRNKSLQAIDVQISKNILIIKFTSGKETALPLSLYPKLKSASESEIKEFIISEDGSKIYWHALDQEIHIENL